MEPKAVFNLELNKTDTKPNGYVVMDLNENELIKFYEVLEDIQTKLDTLYKE